MINRYGKIDTKRIFIIMSEDINDIEQFINAILKYTS